MAAPAPRGRRIGAGLLVLAVVALAAFAIGEYRAWQLRASCTGGGGDWDPDTAQCTFRGTVPAPPTEPAP